MPSDYMAATYVEIYRPKSGPLDRPMPAAEVRKCCFDAAALQAAARAPPRGGGARRRKAIFPKDDKKKLELYCRRPAA